ncbi:MAG: hypothetical protein ABI906_05630, partial [Pseudomonadota bacterium]
RLAGSIADPRRLSLIRTTLPDYQALTVDDVKTAARTWFTDAKAWKLIVRAPPPAGGAEAAARSPTARSGPS